MVNWSSHRIVSPSGMVEPLAFRRTTIHPSPWMGEGEDGGERSADVTPTFSPPPCRGRRVLSRLLDADNLSTYRVGGGGYLSGLVRLSEMVLTL